MMTIVSSLTDDQLAAWRRDGFLQLRGAFGAEDVAAWHAECDRLLASDLVHEDNLRTRFRIQPDGGRILEKFDPVTDVSPVFAALARDERILSPLRQLLGGEPVLFKDKVIFKPPGAGGYGPHQDYTWWQPFPADTLVSVMVAIDGADAANGAIELIPGRHHRHYTAPGELCNLSDEVLAANDLTNWQLVETAPGDLLIFHCLAPHRSGTNVSGVWRRQFYPSYLTGVDEGVWQRHYEHYRGYVEQRLDDAARARLFLR